MTISLYELLVLVLSICLVEGAQYRSSNVVNLADQVVPVPGLGDGLAESVQFLRPTSNGTNDVVQKEFALQSYGKQHGDPKDNMLPGMDHLRNAHNQAKDLNPFAPKENPLDYLKCGVTHKAGANNDKYEVCPKECQYFAQNRMDEDFCTFLCVPEDECGKWNKNKPIAGHFKDSYTCRGPVVQFCTELTLDGKDTCKKCQYGWTVWPGDGQCYFTYWRAIYSFGAALVILVLFLAGYITEWCTRPTINPEGVKQGEIYRSQCKILVPKEELETFYPGEGKHHRCPYPSTTNLCSTDVAGPGMLLHFNFQALLIIWPLCVGLCWTAFACFHNELFLIGTRRFGTPRHNCILVAWGWETQERLMWTKVAFLLIVYVASFIGFLVFGIRQYRMYQEMDAMEKTMKDFVAEVEGLPRVGGAPSVEEDIKKLLEDAGCKNIVGISVCWDYGENQDYVMNEVLADQVEKEIEMSMSTSRSSASLRPKRDRVELRSVADAQNPNKKITQMTVGDMTLNLPDDLDLGPVHKVMYATEMSIISTAPPGDDPEDPEFTSPDPVSENSESSPDLTEKFLKEKLNTSENAFVVFNTEEDRDAAMSKDVLDRLQKHSFVIAEKEYTDVKLKLTYVNCEPATVNWHNYGDSSICGMVKRFFKGFFLIYIPALAIWFFAFYVPYAYSLYNFNYDNGAELPSYYGLLFTMIVVGGNATMYFVCDQVGDVIGFRYKDTKQVAYMLMYLVACTLNVVLDMVTTYYTAYQTMVGLDFRDYYGTKIADYTSFTATFETYAMQRSLAENVKLYAFPSTFLIPFLIEPIVTVWLPYRLGRLIVRTHKEIQGRCAEAYYAPFEFDLGRYADILLNVFLGILIFWFPGGYINLLFFGMAGSHMWIYLFDHYKVLHVIPSIKIVSKEVDSWGQLVLAALTGMILSALVFKGNCTLHQFGLPEYCVQGNNLLYLTAFAGLAHTALHIFLLFTLVPWMGMTDDELEQLAKDKGVIGMTFDAVAEDEPFSWFTANPVHCLRSKYVHKDRPYCRFACVGKEHLLEVNKDIGCFFQDTAGEVEVFDEVSLAKAATEGGKHLFRRITSKFSRGSSTEPDDDKSPAQPPTTEDPLSKLEPKDV